MDRLIEYMQYQHLNIDDASLNELCKELLNQLINSPDVIGKTFTLAKYNNLNFAVKEIHSGVAPIWEKTNNNTFILKGFEKI